MPAIAVQGKIGEAGSKPVTRFTGYDFNSLCSINGFPVAAGDNGLFLLNKGEQDDSFDYERSVSFCATDFNVQQYKRLRFVYCGFSAEEAFNLSVFFDEEKEHELTIIPGKSMLQRSRSSFPRSLSGRYLQFKITTTSSLRIDSISALPVVRHSGFKGYR